ncbi:hypothetical protein ANN_14165 [Periplaneta americana]|uniref:DUF4371 domain-containing protein n=1 Tax=Periplaneta americana TaxID=6978 RepID=A0ABQ8SWX1_PERAM|nr:hypothetical protein ANN_14165 [Periplaneta americana]
MVNGRRVRSRRRYQMIDEIKIYGSYEETKRKGENRKDWRMNIASRLSSAYSQQIELHNKKVRENMYVLSLLINCVRFCGNYELALCGHDESDTSTNPGIFRRLVDFNTEMNESLRTHLDKATVFKGTSKTIQNDLLDCMLQVRHKYISEEIKAANFVAVIADETSDVSNIFQMVLVYRYIVNDNVVERFWRFLNPSNHDAESLSACILKEVNAQLRDAPHKLISQSYNGAAVLSGKERGVQRRRTKALDEVVGRRLQRAAPTRWNFHSQAVLTVYEYREELIECMDEIQLRNDIKQLSTTSQGNGLKIMPHIDILFNQLQKGVTDPVQVKEHINVFENHIKMTRDNIERSAGVKEGNGVSRKRNHEEMSGNRLREARESRQSRQIVGWLDEEDEQEKIQGESEDEVDHISESEHNTDTEQEAESSDDDFDDNAPLSQSTTYKGPIIRRSFLKELALGLVNHLAHQLTLKNLPLQIRSTIRRMNGVEELTQPTQKRMKMSSSRCENFAIKHQNEVMAGHWVNDPASSVTIYTAVLYYRQSEESNELHSQCYAVISDAPRHTTSEAEAFNKAILEDFCNNTPNPTKKVIAWTDGAAAHFKNRYMMATMSNDNYLNGIEYESWNFFESYHGKGEHDGVGATVKRNTVEHSPQIILSLSSEEKHLTEKETACSIDKSESLQLQVGDWCLVMYDGVTYPGEVVTVCDSEEFEVSVMVRDGEHYKWPVKVDKLVYSSQDILQKILPSIIVNNRGHFKFEDLF